MRVPIKKDTEKRPCEDGTIRNKKVKLYCIVNVIVFSSTPPLASCATARNCSGPCDVGKTDISYEGAVAEVPTSVPSR